MDLSVTVPAAIAALAVMGVTWMISVAVRDASLADISWGLAFIAIAWASYVAGEGSGASLLAAILVTLWGLRLAIHIGRRNVGHGEDKRYQAMRAKRPKSFWITSLFTVFILQGTLAFIVSVPLQSLAAQDESIGIISFIGVAVFLFGFYFEAVGDAQLTAFVNDPDSKGKVMDRGLWKYSRHPNYFGDATEWWGLWILAVGSGAIPETIIGPIVMTFFLLKVSGVVLLEAGMAKRRPGYAEYIERTSAFIPLPPKN
jgi:steroid 5-alpha reductase family enzyme